MAWRERDVLRGEGGKSKILSVTRHAPPPWFISCRSGSIGRTFSYRCEGRGFEPRPRHFFSFSFFVSFALSLAVNWTSANAGFAQCRASARVSLSPVALPPWGGNVHERPTRRVHRKKGWGTESIYGYPGEIQFAWARLKWARRAPSRLRCCALPSLYAREHRITTKKSMIFVPHCLPLFFDSTICWRSTVLLGEGGTQFEKRIFWKWPNASKISMEDWFLRGNFSELTSESIQR